MLNGGPDAAPTECAWWMDRLSVLAVRTDGRGDSGQEAPEAEVERAKQIVREEMESVYELGVPLIVDVGVGRNWMEAKP